jgi:hypothetical protein
VVVLSQLMMGTDLLEKVVEFFFYREGNGFWQ